MWAVESPTEVSNSLAFLPLLVVLEIIGLKISWFPICVGETDVATNVRLLQLTLDLVSMGQISAWMAGLMNNGYTFCVEIPLVVSLA